MSNTDGDLYIVNPVPTYVVTEEAVTYDVSPSERVVIQDVVVRNIESTLSAEDLATVIEEVAEQIPTSITVESPGPVTTWNIPHPYDHDPIVVIQDTTGRVCKTPLAYTSGVVHIDISPSNLILKATLYP